MVHVASTLVAAVAGFATVALAHPGHDVRAEAAERAAFLKRAPLHARGLDHCAETLKARGFESRSIARRHHMVENLRRDKGLKRSLNSRTLGLDISHHSSLDVDQNTDPSVIFSSDATCVLGPDVTEGPYYVSGELIRTDVSENQGGVPIYVDVQMVDSTTCEPIPDVYVDFWHCNATGVYSGVVARGNGNSNDATNLDATFLRGLQKTDEDGVTQFKSVFPGHYTGRTTHVHILTHSLDDTSVNANGTLAGLYSPHAAHVGQLFFDQDLISTVEAVAPYSSNTQTLTTNDQDSILAQEAAVIDPFVQYVFLGDSVSDGIFSWIMLAVDPSESNSVQAAVYYTENGGVENPNAGGGGGGPGGPGGPPSV